MTADSEGRSLPPIDVFYLRHREAFFAFAGKHSISPEDTEDIYQDSIIAFYENVENGKLNKMTSTWKTYLFSIGRNLMLNRIKKTQRVALLPEEEMHTLRAAKSVSDPLVMTSEQSELLLAIKQLNSSCREILHLFYYRRYSIEAIAHEMGFKNENTVKANKSRCQKKLRTIYEELIKNK